MSAIAAIAVFPVLTLLLFGLTKVENGLTETAQRLTHRSPADPPPVSETPDK